MNGADQRFRRYLGMVTAMHVLLIGGAFLVGAIRNWWRPARPIDPPVFVTLHAMQPEAPPAPVAEPAPAPVEPPPPTPAPTPRPRVEPSRERVRRDPAPTPQPTLTPEQLRQRMEQAVSPATPVAASSREPDEVARYQALIYQTFYRAWDQPRIHLPGALAVARIRVQRNGQISQREVIRRSRNSAFDESVQQALDAVAQLPPLPASLAGRHHDFTLEFELTGALR